MPTTGVPKGLGRSTAATQAAHRTWAGARCLLPSAPDPCSDDADERAAAAANCRGCPHFEACNALGQVEHRRGKRQAAFVYGGHDWGDNSRATPAPARRTSSRTAA